MTYNFPLPPANIPSEAHPDRYILVVRSDVFCSELIAQFAATAFPGTKTIICHRATDALTRLRTAPAWFGIIDLSLPDLDGLDLIAIAKREHLIARILVATDRHDQWTRQCMRVLNIEGVFDCVSEHPALLPKVMQSVLELGHYRSESFRRDGHCDKRRDYSLTPSEVRVLAVIGDGTADQRAGEVLHLSPHTVHSHRERIMRKLAVTSRTDLMRMALTLGIIRVSNSATLHPGHDAITESLHGLERATTRGV